MDHKTMREKLSFVKQDRLVLSLIGIAIVVLLGFISYNYLTPEWLSYQAEFRDLVGEKFGPERAATAPTGLQQVYAKELDKADRCITCH